MKIAKNIIIIGGPIAAGKSTVAGLLKYKNIQELNDNDELQKLLLESSISGNKMGRILFQLDLMIEKHKVYEKHARDNKEIIVFDRSIIEDSLFAKMTLEEYPNFYKYYVQIFNENIRQMKEEIGFPFIYFLLDITWDTFKNRIFKRNREEEIKNWELNENYYKNLLEIYVPTIEKLLLKHNIRYVKIDANEKNALEIKEEVEGVLESYGIK
ncbi:MAG: deoxynucleoside kinase [Mycoplasma sp.]|nr:deoxynucleoside kinase [Mycoplasma sp.]